MNYRSILLLMMLGSLIAVACQSQQKSKADVAPTASIDSLQFSGAWTRPGSAGGNSAAYVKIDNPTAHADTLRGVSGSVASKTEVHQSFEEDGLSGMRPAGPLPIAADAVLKLQPGGYHIMLMQLKSSITAGDTLDLVLDFSQSGHRSIQLPVRASGPGN